MKQITGTIAVVFSKFNDKAQQNALSLKLDGQDLWFGLGLSDKAFVEVNGVRLAKGMNVTFSYDPDKYNNIDLASVVINEGTAGSSASKENKSYDIGVRVGNATSIAAALSDDIDFTGLIPKIYDLTTASQERLKQKYPKLSANSRGARAGQLYILAAEKTKNIDTFISVAEDLFDQIQKIEEGISSPSATSAPPANPSPAQVQNTPDFGCNMDFDDD